MVLDKLENIITSETLLVSIMHVNNEIGTIQPIKEIAKIIKDKLCYPVTKDEIASAIPSDKIAVKAA